MAAVTSQAAGISAASAAIIGAAVGAGASILVSLINFFIQGYILKQTERQRTREAVKRLHLEQLNDLYAPLLFHCRQSRALHDKLVEGKPDQVNWRLLEHLPEVIADETDRAIAEQIIDTNANVERLLLTKGGLIIDDTPPTSFEQFLGHYRLLTIAFDAAKRAQMVPRDATARRFETFPRQLDQDVEDGYKKLVVERQQGFEQAIRSRPL